MSSKSDHHFADLLGSPSTKGSKKQTLNTIGKAQNTPLKNNSFSSNMKQNTPEMARNAAKPIDTLYQFDSLNISTSPAFSVASDSKISRQNGTGAQLLNGSVLDSNWGFNAKEIDETPLLATSGLQSAAKRTSNNTLLSSNPSSAPNAFYSPADPKSNALSSFSKEVTWEINLVNSKPTAPKDVFDLEYLNNFSVPGASSKPIAAPRETSPASPTKGVERSISPNLKQLLNMGFEESASIASLQRNNGNLEAAVNELIGGPSRSKAPSAKNSPVGTTKLPAVEKEMASDKNKVMDVVNMGWE